MIFVLEDDENIGKLVSYTLQSVGFETKCFERPSDFWTELRNKKPELLILDLMLPEEDGISILKKLRSSALYSDIPVIILTAKSSEFDMINGLDSGADDYISKPFSVMTLVSRVKAVLRRYQKKNGTEKKPLKCGGIKLDKNTHTVFSGEKQVFLTIKEFDLLELLLQNKGCVVTRDSILQLVWNCESDVETRTVDSHIKTLRQKLGKRGELIQTIRGVGYKIEEK